MKMLRKSFGKRDRSEAGESARTGTLSLHITVAWSGAAVMVVEVVGTRLLAPVFGAGLFVWAALLSVTLGSLAIGYYAGGALADRRPVPQSLGLVLAAGGVALGLCVLLDRPVLGSALGLGPRVGPLLSASLLFTPSLVCLGMVGPVAVRLATTEIRLAGHGVGLTYAISTAGSLIGTLAVTFYFIPVFETRTILIATAVMLCCNGAFWLAGRSRLAAMVAAAIVAAPGLGRPPTGRPLPPHLKIVARAQSPYSLLEVIDDSKRGIRVLRADHSVIGGRFADDHTAVFSYAHLIETLRFARPKATKMLQIGLGTGALALAMGRHGVTSDVVEIDPGVVRFAREYFDFKTSGEVSVEDARAFLNRTTGGYDLIVHDTFTGGSAPSHLLSVEVLQRIKAALRPGGVVALNFVGFVSGPESAGTWSIGRTLGEVFSVVRLFRDGGLKPAAGDSLANLIFFATDTSLDFVVSADARFENETCVQVARDFETWEVARKLSQGPLITDSRNPLVRLQAPIAERHFEAMGELLPPEVWLP